jgi:hypothetical protein
MLPIVPNSVALVSVGVDAPTTLNGVVLLAHDTLLGDHNLPSVAQLGLAPSGLGTSVRFVSAALMVVFTGKDVPRFV